MRGDLDQDGSLAALGHYQRQAVDMILETEKEGLTVEGLSFHVGSQTTNFENYVQALNLAAGVYR